MEQWIPLFQIFLHSPSPNYDASQWLHNQTHLPSNPPPTSSFLSLLLSPLPSSPHHLIFFQTLPLPLQSRVLSFLSTETPLFSRHRLHSLATHILTSDLPNSSSYPPTFWVRRAAHHLLDKISQPVQEQQHEEFNSLPGWLSNSSIMGSGPLLPWLPLSPAQLVRTSFQTNVVSSDDEHERMDSIARQENVQFLPIEAMQLSPLDDSVREKALALRAELLGSESIFEAHRLTREIGQLCLDRGVSNRVDLLCLIQPWEADDEMLAVLLSHIADDGRLGCEGNWLAHVLCSTALPKLLSLKRPASRVLLSSVIGFCKAYPTAAVEALLFPLALRKGGINSYICDVLTRIIKECLHLSHVSAFCQRLLCGEGMDRKHICLPCHEDLISDELVWTEPLFTLFQQILNRDVHLTPDTIDRLVSVIDEMAGNFSRSLKFGNFLLCFVAKCTQALKLHNTLLERAAKKTDTFVTKSILSKFGEQ